jgi:mycofactocin system glycosyltransferase
LGYRLASGVELAEVRGGPALLNWTRLRLVRVNPPLATLLSSGGSLVPRTPAEAKVLQSLLEKAFLVDEPAPELAPAQLPSVSVVIPVKDRAEELRRCLESLKRVRYPPEKIEILVVDDGSRDASAEVARSMGATVIPSGGEGRGPAAARNRGAAAAHGDVLAFIDSDCAAWEEWLEELAGHFEDADVAAVGGGVDGMHASSALDRYEAEMSSLSLGPLARSGQGGKDTFYLPSCNLLVRRRDFLDAGGFREGMHVAEDVDLSWRLRDRGRKIVYTPRGAIVHEHRNRLRAFLRRRFQYGTSEGILQLLHPERRKRLVLPPALAAGSLLLALSFLLVSALPAVLGAAVVAVDAMRLWRKLRRQGVNLSPGRVLRARVKAWGSLLYYVSYHLTRYYLPLLVLGSLAWPRFAVLAGALALWCACCDYRMRRPALAFPAFFAFYLAEHLAYGAGVFRGCLRERSFRSYRPVFSSR